MPWIKNPYDKVLKYFILYSRSPGEFENFLKKYQIDYLFDMGEARTCFDIVKKGMPEELFFWHDQGDEREQFPPAKEALEWCAKNDIEKFYFNLFLKKGETDENFINAYHFFSLRNIRKISESMKLSEFDVEDIFGIADSLKANVTPAGLDVFFSEFFDISCMDVYELDKWVAKLEVHGKAYPHYSRDALGKRFALSNPFDISVTGFYNYTVMVTDQEMLATIKQNSFRKFLMESNDMNYDREASPTRMAALAATAIATMREGRDSGISREMMKDNKSPLYTMGVGKKNVLEAKILKEQNKLASRSIPEAEIVAGPKDSDESKN